MRELKISRQALNVCRSVSSRNLNRPHNFSTSFKPAPQTNRDGNLTPKGTLNVASILSSAPSFEPISNQSCESRVIDLEFLLKSDKSDVPHWVNSPVDLAMYKSANLDELLNVAEKFRLSGVQTVTFFVQMARFAPLDVKKVENDARFSACCQTVMNETEVLPFNHLLMAFRSLLYVGFQRQISVCAKLQSAIEKRIAENKMSILALVSFACFHVDYDQSGDDKSELQKMMEARIFDQLPQISDPQHILLILNKLCRERKENCERMAAAENKALELVDFMSPEDLVNLLNYVSTARSRNVHLLKAVAGKIVASSGVFSAKRIASILMSLNKLSYFTPALLQRIFMDLMAQVNDKMKPIDFYQICTQMGLCRLRHTVTIDKLIYWLSSNYASCKPAELIGFVLLLARCNFTSTAAVDLCERIKSDLSLGAVNNDKLLWLDYVWALAVLNLLTPSLADSVLNDGFYKSLIDDNDEHRATISKLKLLNINAAVEIDLKGEPISLNSASQHFVLVKNLQMIRRKQKTKLIDQFSESLNVLAPKETYTKFTQITPEGYAIDAEIVVDENSKPIPIKDWSHSTSDGRKNVKNIAFILLDYTDITLLSNSLTGLNAMAIRHLRGKGRLVAEVPAYEFKKRQNILERATYLKSIIGRLNSAND